MKQVAILLVLAMSACNQQSSDRTAQQPTVKPMPAPAPQSKMAATSAAAKAGVLPLPEDKQQLERLLAMGYSVHEDHLHPPGMKECPFNMGGSVVQ